MYIGFSSDKVEESFINLFRALTKWLEQEVERKSKWMMDGENPNEKEAVEKVGKEV